MACFCLDRIVYIKIIAYIKYPSNALFVDKIKLPRVNVTFKANIFVMIGWIIEHRLHINDHSGLNIVISTESREIVEKILDSIKHFIVLQNIDNNIFIIIPGCALPRQLTMDGNDLSVQVLLDRRNQE